MALVAADQLKLTVAVEALLPCPDSQASLLAGRLNAVEPGGGVTTTSSSVEQLNTIPAISMIKSDFRKKRIIIKFSL